MPGNFLGGFASTDPADIDLFALHLPVEGQPLEAAGNDVSCAKSLLHVPLQAGLQGFWGADKGEHPAVNRFNRSSRISHWWMTQPKRMYCRLLFCRKLRRRKAMFSITIALFSSLTTKGSISQHQSPSRKTLGVSIFLRDRQVAVFPTPMVPLMTINCFFTASSLPRTWLLGGAFCRRCGPHAGRRCGRKRWTGG